jgi:fibronectin type 3 domain-containing protein
MQSHVYRMDFLGASRAEPVGIDRLSHNSNFFIGQSSPEWFTDVPNFREICYPGLYDGIDLHYRSLPGGLKYEFVVHPGGNPEDIRLGYEGADVSTDGSNVFLRTSVGTVVDGELLVYQPGGAGLVKGARVELRDNIVSYSMDYDRTRDLVIDPLVYSTYLGGSFQECARAIELDIEGNAYVTGNTTSMNFPTTPGAYDTSFNMDQDVFVVKVNSSGSSLDYATYLGSSTWDYGYDIELDASNNAYLTGGAGMTFPYTSGAYYCTTHNGGLDQAFIAKLNPAGNGLVFSFRPNTETAFSLAIDGNGCSYITGWFQSTSPILTTQGAYNRWPAGMRDAFVAKFSADGGSIVYCTAFGGSRDDVGMGIDADSAGNACIVGYTNSWDLPMTPGTYDNSYNGSSPNYYWDTFVSKFNAQGSTLLASTFYGRAAQNIGTDIVLDPSGEVYITGEADLVVKFNNQLSSVLYTSPAAPNYNDVGMCIALDADNNAFVAGYTSRTTFPVTADAYQPEHRGGYWEAFLCKFNHSDGGIEYATYFGGGAWDRAYGVAVDALGHSYISGQTASSNLTTTASGYDRTLDGPDDAFVAELYPPTRPGVPRNLTATEGDRRVSLSWQAASGELIRKYHLYRTPNPASPGQRVWSGNLTSAIDNGVTNGQTYYYSVSAENIVGEGLRSATVAATPGREPDSPRSISATGAETRIRLDWLAPADDGGFRVIGYRIFRNVSTGPLKLYEELALATTYTDKEVLLGLAYSYAVSAYNVRGENISGDVSASTYVRPSAPRNVTSLPEDRDIRLSWEAPLNTGGAPLLYYSIYRGTDPGELFYLNRSYSPGYQDKDPGYGIPFYYRISATNLKGEGERSQMDDCTLKYAKPGPARNLFADAGDGQVLLGWYPPSNDGGSPVSLYKVYRGPSVDSLGFLDSVTTPEYSDLMVTNGQTYYYAVSAVNQMGEGVQSDRTGARPTGQGKVPGPVGDLSGQTSDGLIILSWLPPRESGGLDITGYSIYRGDDQKYPTFLSSTSATAYMDNDVTERTYSYSVSALNPKGEGKRTAPLNVTLTVPGTAPGAPMNLSVSAGFGFVHLGWDPPDDSGGQPIQGYRVFRASGRNMTLLASPASTGFRDESVTNGLTYLYKVSAVNRKGEGISTRPVSGSPGKLPGAISDLTAKMEKGEILLRWSPPADRGGFQCLTYKIYGGDSSDAMILLGESQMESFTDVGKAGNPRYYRLVASNIKGDGPALELFIAPGKTKSVPSSVNYTELAAGIAIMAFAASLGAMIVLRKRKSDRGNGPAAAAPETPASHPDSLLSPPAPAPPPGDQNPPEAFPVDEQSPNIADATSSTSSTQGPSPLPEQRR